MEKRKIFKNGEKYPLKEFFKGINEKIIIPDLQRDYCWGASNLVEKFVVSLLKLDRTQPITLGLIYGYVDNSLVAEHLQLCDGQQRLTTIFLLLGELYRRLKREKIKHHLISDFELNDDDREPYLLYAIRESSLYFLSDLTYYYFLGNNIIENAGQISDQPWFLSGYKQDPSIKSMLSALSTIERLLDKANVDLTDFADFLLDKVEFLYVDMYNRSNGEETFVVINTTGEPLTSNENDKPKVIRANYSVDDAAMRWEEMEQWFWINRNRTANPEHTSEEGFEQFVRIVKLMQSASDRDYISIRENIDNIPLESIAFEQIYASFKAYKRIYDLHGYQERYDDDVRPDYTDGYSENDLFRLLPVIKYVMKYPDSCDEDVLRVFHIYRNNSRYRNTDVNKTDLYAPAYRAMATVSMMTSSSPENIFASSFMPADEKRKYDMLSLWRKGCDESQCHPMERIVARAEKHKILRGRVSLFLDWADYDEENMIKYINRFELLWPSAEGHGLDKLRRTLLCMGLSDYPIRYQGKGINTFCNEPEQWYSLMMKEDNSDIIRKLLDDNRQLDDIIDENFADAGYFKSLVSHPEWWERMERANVLLYNENMYILLRKERTSSDYWLIYHGESFGSKYYGHEWAGVWKYPDNNGIYCDHRKYDVTMDIEYTGESFMLVLGEGKYDEKLIFPHLEDIALRYELKPYDRNKFKRSYAIHCNTVEEVKILSHRIGDEISGYIDIGEY
ncbi:MAG: DUF262 domain-containing protein [Duncaniella sp.]|nr:DUF262 domain-containing protein [Duncaniella sp.]